MLRRDASDWSSGSGQGRTISTYLREKRDHVLSRTPHRLLQIVPGPEDRVIADGRHTFVEVAADRVRGSPDYRLILRPGAVRRLLAEHRPDLIESLCPYVLPWAAIHHRRRFPATALVAGYRTDFPNANVLRVGRALFPEPIARACHWLSLGRESKGQTGCGWTGARSSKRPVHPAEALASASVTIAVQSACQP